MGSSGAACSPEQRARALSTAQPARAGSDVGFQVGDLAGDSKGTVLRTVALWHRASLTGQSGTVLPILTKPSLHPPTTTPTRLFLDQLTGTDSIDDAVCS